MRGRMLSWDDFRFVKAIADTRSLAGAAEALGVNHSTVFRRLGQIEQQLGSRLFERGRGGYALTACGEEMVELAERMGEDIVTFERKVTGQDLRPSGELRVTTTDTILLHLLSDVLVGFRRAYPEIMLDIVVSNRGSICRSATPTWRCGRPISRRTRSAGRRVARIAWAVFGPSATCVKPLRSATDGRRHDWIAFTDLVSIAKAMKWLKSTSTRAHRLQGEHHAGPGGSGSRRRRDGAAAMLCRRRGAGAGADSARPSRARRRALADHAPDLRNTARVRAFLDFCAGEIAKRREVIEC